MCIYVKRMYKIRLIEKLSAFIAYFICTTKFELPKTTAYRLETDVGMLFKFVFNLAKCFCIVRTN